MTRVITFGTFDVLHVGHLQLLERAKALGCHLSVGVSTDDLSAKKKGRPPVYPLDQRMRILSSLRMVDFVFVEESLEAKRGYITEYAADVFVIGDDWRGKFDGLCEVCKVVYLPRTEGISTTAVIERIRG